MLQEYQRVLVTGGLGFIGRHLVNKLTKLGKEVIILDNFSTADDVSVVSSQKIIRGDIRFPKEIETAIQGVDLVIHVAANANVTLSIENIEYDFYTNTVGTFNLLNAAVKSKVKRFVYVSSAAVYGIPRHYPIAEDHITSPIFPYGSSKLGGELCCMSFFHSQGFPIVIGRPFAIYGPGENPKVAMVEIGRYMRWHLNHQPIQIVGDLNRKTRDFVHVDDVVDGLLLIAEKAEPGQKYNIGSGEEISMQELASAIEKVTDHPVLIENFNDLKEDSYRLVSDISKLKALGYQPQVSLLDGLYGLKEYLGRNPELPGTPVSFKKGIKV